MKPTTVEEFYKEVSGEMPEASAKEIGHFDVFNMEELVEKLGDKLGAGEKDEKKDDE